MRKFMKKALTVLMAAVLCVGVYAPVAKADASSVIIHAKDGQAWGSLNVYNWGDNGETAGVWPGTAMTAEADGWYTYTIDTEVPLNLVFSAEGGSPQSSNIDAVAADAGEIWVVIGGEGAANDLGASTNEAKLYLEPQDGWPVADAVEAAADNTAATDAAADTAATDTAATDTAQAATDVPKTGETVGLTVAFLALAALSAAGFVALKKKSQTSAN
ncbi:MAG TPA: starch-binding protein [Mobilitalea sp.]|nr:starch-binding protein [Mobilitalea sp.]